jgi:hypothetical protein
VKLCLCAVLALDSWLACLSMPIRSELSVDVEGQRVVPGSGTIGRPSGARPFLAAGTVT